jgi:N-acetylglucosamine-6-sulfatase
VLTRREHRYKYIRYRGIWDIDELYDLQADPLEANNLIFAPGHVAIVQRMNRSLFDALEGTGGMSLPLTRDAGDVQRLRRSDRAKAAEFPLQLLKKAAPPP